MRGEILGTILDAVGNTPMVRLSRLASETRTPVVAKLEFLNPGGSIKDRIGLAMIEAAEQAGELHPGGTIVEPTSGNPAAHEATTGPEIWRQTEGRITHLVAGMGTGGTITGVGRFLKQRKPDLQIVGADPVGSIYSAGEQFTPKIYKVEGIGEDFMP